MKLISWNVNGIRSAARKGLLEWLQKEQPDILCLQETKADPEQLEGELVRPPGYEAVFAPAKRRGYSGVATFWRKDAAPVSEPRLGMGIERFDREGRLIATEHKDFVLVNSYVPNSQADLARLDFKIDFCDSLLAYCNTLRERGKPLIACGDFNAAHTGLDIHPKEAIDGRAGYHPRERQWVSELVERGYVDIFRKFCPEGGHYTWWNYLFKARQANIGWRIDYFFVTEDLAERVEDAYHLPEVKGSDHCPVGLLLKD